jgi:putative nucleotidyltransferase with HDIG domain
MDVSRDAAWDLFCEWTESDSLRKHVLAVEAAMVAYARAGGEDEELWAATGILHDLDYEKYPDLDTGHPRIALRELEKLGYPPELIDAVAGHAERLGVPRTTPLAKTLYAVDELSGFVTACALVRPTGIHGMTPKSVKKKMKTPAFAAAVDRDEMRAAAEDLGVDFDQHVANVIAAMEERASELGLDGAPAEGDAAASAP